MSSLEHEKYQWYEVVEGAEILQGDLLDSCSVLVPTVDSLLQAENTPIEILECDVIVMSQSCDLIQEKIELVLVCPIHGYEEMAAKDEYQHLRSSRVKDELLKGLQPGYHVLRQSDIDGWERPIRLVDFRNVYGLPFDYLKHFAADQSPRLRLMPPYREHLAQAFARFFMRVGLPVDVRFP